MAEPIELSPEELARMPACAERWVRHVLSTDPVDRPRFAAAVATLYRRRGYGWTPTIVWVDSPLAMAISASVAAAVLDRGGRPLPARRARYAETGVERFARWAAELRRRRRANALLESHWLTLDDYEGWALKDDLGVANTAVWEGIGSPAGDARYGAAFADLTESDEAFTWATSEGVRDVLRPDNLAEQLWAFGRTEVLPESVGAGFRETLAALLAGPVGDDAREAVAQIAGRDATVVVDELALDAAEERGTVRPGWQHRVGRVDGDWRLGCHFAPPFGLGFTHFLRELGFHINPRVDAWQTTFAAAPHWWPFHRFIVACNRPSHTSREATDAVDGLSWRLHSDDGPAVAWRDGWVIHALHGVRVPAWVVEQPDQITWQSIMAEPDTEVRRVMLGNARDSVLAAADLLNSDVFGDLYRFPPLLSRSNEPTVVLRLVCPSTGRVYLERVPPTMTTAREAVAWQFNLATSDYAPTVES
jgi:hypothetical protein